MTKENLATMSFQKAKKKKDDMPSYKGILSETDLESLILFIEALEK